MRISDWSSDVCSSDLGSTARSPMTFQEFVADESSRRRYWARAHIGWSRMSGAQPNATHRWLAERQLGLAGLITQNVDTLHDRAETEKASRRERVWPYV